MAGNQKQRFLPGKMSQEAKAAATDNAAHLIVAAEIVAREKKTAKLRALRLQQPQEHMAEAASVEKRKRKK